MGCNSGMDKIGNPLAVKGGSEMDEKFMSAAIGLALENAAGCGGGPFGAVIVKDGEIVASASNSVTVDNDPTAHAEVNAIRQACRRLGTFSLDGCVLYTSCEPCPMCLSAAYWARIGKIYYAAGRKDAADAGFDDAFIYEEIPLGPSERSIRSVRIMAAEGERPFRLWASNGNKTVY